MFKMDLSKFKKVAGDKHHTTLRHENGHEFKVVHSALPPKMRLKLKALKMHKDEQQTDEPVKLADGGESQDEMSRANRGEEIYEKDKYGNITGKKKPPKQKYEESHKKAFNEWFPMADGGEAKEESHTDEDKWKAFQQGFNQSLADGGPAKEPVVINIGTPNMAPESLPAVAAAQNQPDQPQQAQPMMEQQTPQAQPMVSQASAQGLAQAPTQAPQQQSDPFGYGRMGQDVQQGLEMQRQATLGEASALSDSAKAEQAIAKRQAASLDKLMKLNQENFAQLQQETSSVLEDMRTAKIDPNKYMNEMGTGEKVMTAIGLLLGGLGQGFIGGDNPALTYLNAQIDRNLKSQQANMDNKATLLGAYYKKFGNMQDALNMTRIVNEQYYASLMQEQAAKLKDPMAKLRAQQMIGEMQQKNAGQLADISRRQTILQGGQQGVVQPEAMINVIVPEKDQKAAREELGVIQGIDKAASEISQIIDRIGKIGPLQALPFSQGKAALDTGNAQIIQAIRANMKGQGALSDQEIEDTIKPLMIGSTDTPAQVAEKRSALLNAINNKRAGAAPTLSAYPMVLQAIKKPSTIKEGPPKL